MKKVKTALIGLGNRGLSLLKTIILPNPKSIVTAVCDVYADRLQTAQKLVVEKEKAEPFVTQKYMDIIGKPDVDLVVIASSWETHIPIALECMRHGKRVAMEVGGSYSIEQCYDLVRCYEETKTPFMFLENCCYGKRELMILNMVEKGILGEIVHCAGGYHHDLRNEVAFGKENRHYRLRNYLNRNCENYPTHELGPIARVLNINHGNRMISLTSTASKAAGLQSYAAQQKPDDLTLTSGSIMQGDIVTTVIKCSGGETITLTLDTTLPRYYSRGFQVRGTKGMYEEETDSIFLDEKSVKDEWNWKPEWGNAAKHEEQFLHPIWKDYLKQGVRGSHDGMDWLMFDRMFDCILQNQPFEIDVYDAASWMSITALSEKSIILGSHPVEIPDFTNGFWISR